MRYSGKMVSTEKKLATISILIRLKEHKLAAPDVVVFLNKTSAKILVNMVNKKRTR